MRLVGETATQRDVAEGKLAAQHDPLGEFNAPADDVSVGGQAEGLLE
jgi:hypothetical protein